MINKIPHNILLFGLVLAIFQLPACVLAQPAGVGRVVDTIKCINHSDQSYAIYLPSRFTARSVCPLIIIFDPGARGHTAVEVFRQAAEKYGYIVACSNNSRNGPLNINLTAAELMLSDIEKRFTPNERMIIAAGFSGGSRFALALAGSGKKFAGVIGCGAGLPNDKTLYPTPGSSFIYYGIAGTRDMNYLEMFDLNKFFYNQTRVVSYLRTFDGGHQWPSPDIIQEAVEWINFQSMKIKTIPADSAFIKAYSNKIKTLVNNLLSTGNQFDASRYAGFAVRDFSGTPFSIEMKNSLSAVSQSKELKDATREWNNIAATEQSRNGNYVTIIGNILNSGIIPDTASGWWKNEIETLKIQRDKGKLQKSQMASRLLNFISILCSEQASSLYRQKYYDLAVFLFRICTYSDSENMNNYFNLARSLAAVNKKREAIDALGKAADHGFSSLKAVTADPVFNNIRNDEKYKLLLTRLK
jgi:hypothetical protein